MNIKQALILVATTLLGACAINQKVATGAATSTAIPEPGGTFKECRNCPDMVVIPAGSFVMGTPATEDHHRPLENQHRVTIAKPFAVSRTEVTWDQWEACVRDGRAVVDDLVQSVVFVGLRGVKDVDKAVGTGGEEERGMGWVQS